MNYVAKLMRNIDLVVDLASFALSSSFEDRARRLERIQAWTQRRALSDMQARAMQIPKGYARELAHALPDFERQLRATPHLGVLSGLLPRSISRLAYVGRQSELILALKERHPGLALATKDPQTGLTGLETTQAWSILLNYGHLWGTQATERAVLFELRRERNLRRLFLRSVPDRDQAQLSRLLSQATIYNFNRVLAFWRLVRLIPKEQEWNGRDRAGDMLRVLLGSDRKDSRSKKLAYIYETTRRLAYIDIHSMLGLQPAFGGELLWAAIDRTAEDGNIDFASKVHENSPHEQLLVGVDQYQHRAFFTAPASSKAVLTHLREFRAWWRVQKDPLVAISSLFERPQDWPSMPAMGELHDIVRFELPLRPRAWLDEVEHWWDGGRPWQGDLTNILVTSSPHGSSLVCDVVGGRSLSASELSHCASQLARVSEQRARDLDPKTKTLLGKSASRLLLLLLDYQLPESLRARLQPTEGLVSSSYSWVGAGTQGAVSWLTEIASETSDLGRSNELRSVAEWLGGSSTINNGSLVLTTAGRLLIEATDTSKPVAELDGVIAFFEHDTIVWKILEVKTTHLSGSKRQLERISECLGFTSSETTRSQTKHGRIRVLSGGWFSRQNVIAINDR